MKKLVKVAVRWVLGSLFFAFAPAGAAILEVDVNGNLTGANNVNVNGTLYDVDFLTLSYFDVYGKPLSEVMSSYQGVFTFWGKSSESNAAAFAILDQVLIDGPDGNFDSDPSKAPGYTNLNGNLNGNWIHTLWAQNVNTGLLLGHVAINTSGIPNGYCSSRGVSDPVCSDFYNPLYGVAVASWTLPSPAAVVPEPASLALLGLGLAGLGAMRRMQKTA